MRQALAVKADESFDMPALAAWREVPGKGRGVVALRDLAAGDIIERSPVLIVPNTVADDTLLDEYVFWWTPTECAVALGLMMVYNHSDDPNAKMDCQYDDRTVTMTALRSIRAGEEICWNYGIELWFDAAK